MCESFYGTFVKNNKYEVVDVDRRARSCLVRRMG